VGKTTLEMAQVMKAKQLGSSPTAEDRSHHLSSPTLRKHGDSLAKHSNNGRSHLGESLPPDKLHQQQFEGSAAPAPSQTDRWHLASEM